MTNYGIEAAKRRAEEKKEREKIKQEKELKRALKAANQNAKGKSNMKKLPNIDWQPKLPPKKGKYGINWLDSLTVSASNGLLDRVQSKQSSLQLLKMPPGTGKTAVIVRTLGELQRQMSEPLEFALVLPPNVYQQKSWHGTIQNYNFHHKDNQLKPTLITTLDKFSNLLAHPLGLMTLKNEYGFGQKKCILVMDELHNYKNPVSKRSKMLQKLPPTVYKLGLTGTPLTNDEVLDGSSYLIMGGYYRNKSDFIYSNQLQYTYDQYYNLQIYDENKRVLTGRFPKYPQFLIDYSDIVFTPEQVRNIKPSDIGMPDRIESVLMLPYNQLLNDDLLSLQKAHKDKMFDSYTDLYMEIVRRLHTDSERLDMLMEIINDKKHQQPLIFYSHKLVRDAIVERFKAEGVPVRIIDGDEGHTLSNIDKDDLSPILLQYQSGSEAIEFKKSNTTVMFEHQPSASVLEQARNRNVRRNMEHDDDIQLYYIVADTRIDQAYYSLPLLREQSNNKTDSITQKINEINNEEELIDYTIQLLMSM